MPYNTKAKQRAYQQRNKVKLAKYYKQQYKKTQKRRKASSLAYHYKHRTKILKRMRKYYQSHKKQRKAYNLKHRSKILKQQRKSNKQRYVLYSRTPEFRYPRMLQRSTSLTARGCTGKSMSLEEYKAQICNLNGTNKKCWYCFGEVGSVGIGLDRKDNNIVYTKHNTVSCCIGCNAWRNNRYTVAETRLHFKPMRDAAIEKSLTQ